MLTDAKLRVAAKPLWKWMAERHAIYCRKEQGKPMPWTNDKILQTFRFCNVYRELDTTTIWIRRNWREPMRDSPHLWFAMLVSRMINLPNTMVHLTAHCGLPEATKKWCDKAERQLAQLVSNGEKIYGSAYIMTAGGMSGPKYRFTMKCLRAAVKNPLQFATWNSLEEMWTKLRELPGCGNFIAYEIATDLRWTRYYQPEALSDHLSWGNPGPGAVRGINRIINKDKDKPIGRREDYIKVMAHLTEIANALPQLKHMPRFEVRDIEHSLCETDKMLRVKNGEGRPKQLYVPAC